MSEPLRLGDDVGFLDVEIGPHTQQIDLWDVYVRLGELHSEHQSSAAAYYSAVLDLLCSLGFPRLSSHVAERFVVGVYAKVAELKKSESDANTPASPASTVPTPSGTCGPPPAC